MSKTFTNKEVFMNVFEKKNYPDKEYGYSQADVVRRGRKSTFKVKDKAVLLRQRAAHKLYVQSLNRKKFTPASRDAKYRKAKELFKTV